MISRSKFRDHIHVWFKTLGLIKFVHLNAYVIPRFMFRYKAIDVLPILKRYFAESQISMVSEEEK